MTDREDHHPVEKAAVDLKPAPQEIHARPVHDPIDWDALIDRIHRDFPRTLARLAE